MKDTCEKKAIKMIRMKSLKNLSSGASFLMIQKKVECWILWIIIDVVATGVYFAKGINLLGLEYLVRYGLDYRAPSSVDISGARGLRPGLPLTGAATKGATLAGLSTQPSPSGTASGWSKPRASGAPVSSTR